MIKTSAPGRICLFGEHQDYLKLPVISAAIDLCVSIEGEKRLDKVFTINLPDIKQNIKFEIPDKGQELGYILDRDYFRSVYNHLQRHGAIFNNGWSCEVSGNIPINTGTASSSALCVAWTRFLIKANSKKELNFFDDKQIGRIAYLAEVEEFGEPGGMMDHYASSLGGVLYQDFDSNIFSNIPHSKMGTFILGDSLEPKNTLDILSRVKYVVIDAINKIKKENKSFEIKTVSRGEINDYNSILNSTELRILEGTIRNRDITSKAFNLLKEDAFNLESFKGLLNEHQYILSKYLKISTPKIDSMLTIAENNGAYGGKINGSGGGGCMFAYAPENAKKIAQSIEDIGAKVYIVNVKN